MRPAEFIKLFLFFLLLSAHAFGQNFAETHSKIRRHVEAREYAAAIADLKTLEQADKAVFALNNLDYLLARLSEKEGDFAVAAANYEAVVKRDSILSEYALWHLAQIFRSSGNLMLERVYLRKLLTLAPDSLLQNAATYRLPRSYFESKDYETTVRLLTSGEQTAWLNKPPANPTVQKAEDRERLVLLAQSYLQSNRVNEAREIFTRLTNSLPNAAQPDDFALAGALALDEIAVGKDNFGKVAPALPDTEHIRRAAIYQFNRNFALARLHYQALVKSYPASSYAADALFQTGRGLAQERNFNEAINYFERVQAEFPDAPVSRDALSQAAAAYARVNKPKEAISRYQKFIEIYPDAETLDRAYLNLIDVLRDTGANTEALKWTQKTQENFRGKSPEAVALFAEARIRIAQNEWTDALNALEKLQGFADLGTRAAGGTNNSEVVFLKAFALENLDRFEEAIDVYLSIPDGRNEYYGNRATERLKMLARAEKSQSFTVQKIGASLKNIETRNPEAQRKAAQSVLRLTDNTEIRASMLNLLRKAYADLPEYQKIPTGKILELGRKEVLREKPRASSTNPHQALADELLFLGLYDEAAPELEKSRQTTNQEPKTKDQSNDFNFNLATFFKRGDLAHRAVVYAEPLWKTVPADYEIELIPREHLELLYPAPYAEWLLRYAQPRQVDPRFILAIMRQESRFRADVKSNAAARGLMQFISTTGAKIADELERENFRQDELYNPSTAILFGAQYLQNLFKIFPNQPPAVAASYNGGEDNMLRWLARSKTADPDRYVAETVFSQSKDYVYKVMAAYRVYQMLYDEQLKAKSL